MRERDRAGAEEALLVGRVIAVEGRRVKVAVDKLKNGSHTLYRGALVRNPSVGGLVKLTKGFASLVGTIDGEYVHEDRVGVASPYRRDADRIARTLEVSLIGYLDQGRFFRGIREMPLLDNECFVLTDDELRAVHQFARPDEPTFRLGTLATDETQPVELGLDGVFASHIGIFGNTGSGKSYTLAKLYHELFRAFGARSAFRHGSRVVLVDFNGEYVDRPRSVEAEVPSPSTAVIVGTGKRTYQLSTRLMTGDRLPFASEALDDPVFWHVLLNATEKTQAPFVSRALRTKRFDDLTNEPQSVLDHLVYVLNRATTASERTVDRQTAKRLLWDVRDLVGQSLPGLTDVARRAEECLSFHGGDNQTYKWIEGQTTWADQPGWESHLRSVVYQASAEAQPIDGLDVFALKLVLQYYDEVARGFSNSEHLGPLVQRLKSGLPDIKKVIEVSDRPLADEPLTVVSLQDVNLSMRKVVPLLLSKRLFDLKKRDAAGGPKYLNLVIDEAHNILSAQSSRETEAWRDYRLETFEEIIKEGRKFGVFLTIASQRPHDISETIVSQLHHYFLHRLVNNLDVRSVERAVAYLDAVSFESIPILATGTCIVAGISAQVPIVVRVDRLPLEAQPTSQTMSVVETFSAAGEGPRGQD